MRRTDDDRSHLTAETLLALEVLGFTAADRVCLRFSCEVSSVREAVDLAADLRALGPGAVQIGPRPVAAGNGGRWCVALKVPHTPLDQMSIAHWEGQVEAAAHGRPACRYVGWTPLLDPGEVKRRAARRRSF